ncbi:MAG: TIGR01777 family oxidoreductase [Candidatus Hydrogenedentes bacterium]|nr:TIGR01777 family oxidoreductase [Candidatus Hydrogenedentota bacterium]
MKVIISGASGFIGTSLSNFLSNKGYDVWRLTREEPKQDKEIFWDPYRKIVETKKLDGANVFINLSGENIGKGIWTNRRKEILINSRIVPSKFLVETIKYLPIRPKFYFTASAIGIYGPTANNIMSENCPYGNGFLANLCKEWEKTVESLRHTEVKTVIMRFGVVLGPHGGMLSYLLKIFSLYLGGIVGDKNSYISWISIDDVCEAIHFLIQKDKILGGPYNFVSPNSITQKELTKVLSEALGKPAIFKVPTFVIKTILGEMGKELILANQAVYPDKLLKEGYEFRYNELSKYLENILSKGP